jgi:HEAT repeat protein
MPPGGIQGLMLYMYCADLCRKFSCVPICDFKKSLEMKHTNTRDRSRKHNKVMPDRRALRQISLTKLTVIAASLLVPGILFSFAQEHQPASLTTEFVKASPQTRLALAKSLIQRGKDAVPIVLPLLDNADAEVQVQALAILEHIGAVEVRSNVSAKLTDGNTKVRAAAAGALGVLGNVDTTPALFTALTDPDRSVRISSTLALGRLKVASAASSLRSVALRGDLDATERQAAIMSLGTLRSREAVDGLISIATSTSEQEQTRSIAIASLGEIGDTEALKPILNLVGDTSETIRFNVVASLGSLGGSEAQYALIRVLRNPQEADFIRIRAAWAIRSIGTDVCIKELFLAARADNEFIAMHAVRVLIDTKTPGGKDAAENLAARTKDTFVRATLEKLMRDNVEK